ncbi:MAG: hypothetical protein QOI38_1565 [Sphingomonadales bacterium]|jgi:hypothetical protein|nr:hypothetical protein [Sphingomonadales bacterium]
MTDARSGAALPARADGFFAFLAGALAALADRALLLPVLLLTLLLTLANIVLAGSLPETRSELLLFEAVALARVIGLLLLFVAMLRIVNRSLRSPWRPDAGLALYGLTFLFGVGLTLGLARLLGGGVDPAAAGVIVGAGVSIVTAPLTAWFVAIAVERPLAWRAGPWLRGFGTWLPPLLLWSLILIVPLGQLHATIDGMLVESAGLWFWPLALADGLLGVLLALLGLGLASAAYRSVARG